MPNFMIAYHGGNQPSSKEDGAAHMEKWKAWVQGLGDAVVNPGTPLMSAKLVTSAEVQDDANSNSMKGFAVINVNNIDDALTVAKSDPFLEMGGTIRVSEMKEMPCDSN